MDELCREVGEELESGVGPWGTLTVGCYLHARIAEIHPFADGNGRCARLMENLVRVSLGAPPTMVREQDRLSYYGALDEFYEEGSLRGMRMFTAASVIRWFEGREG